jgi:hypothetical protein
VPSRLLTRCDRAAMIIVGVFSNSPFGAQIEPVVSRQQSWLPAG